MDFIELIKISQVWLYWIALGLGILTFLSFVFKWGIKFRLTGSTIFTALLCASCWAFEVSYSPPFKVERAVYAPIVYDNGNDLVIAQASDEFPIESIQPTLEQIAGNLKGGGRKGKNVNVRLRKIKQLEPGIDKPVIMGEVIRDIKSGITLSLDKDEDN
tara:strand:+ start:1702 stop:2178 length:477 start_codon:yes stop_codon:yes gene_type:complete